MGYADGRWSLGVAVALACFVRVVAVALACSWCCWVRTCVGDWLWLCVVAVRFCDFGLDLERAPPLSSCVDVDGGALHRVGYNLLSHGVCLFEFVPLLPSLRVALSLC